MRPQTSMVALFATAYNALQSFSESHTSAGVAAIRGYQSHRNCSHLYEGLPGPGYSMPETGIIESTCLSPSCFVYILAKTVAAHPSSGLCREGCSFLAADRRIPDGLLFRTDDPSSQHSSWRSSTCLPARVN